MLFHEPFALQSPLIAVYGDHLNKALEALEDENVTKLESVLKSITPVQNDDLTDCI